MNPLRWLAIRLGAQPWLPKFAKFIVGFDKLIQRVTRGHLTLLAITGLPELMLTVPGRKSGIMRSTPLLCVPHDGGWLVAGSNWGAPQPPAWIGNLLAADRASVSYRGQDHVVEPHLATGAERAALWQIMLKTWPNYDKYAQRTTREIKVVHLRPVGR
jgi:deazaflavin-dependent oxidoreductase (nitroreductase family)